MNDTLTEDEWKAVRGAVRGVIDLLRGYVKLRPEDKKMERRQAQQRKRLALLRTAKAKMP